MFINLTANVSKYGKHSYQKVDNLSYICKKHKFIMSLIRVILSIIFPPLAVIDKGCGSVLIVLLLTLAGWIPGVIGALVILNKS